MHLRLRYRAPISDGEFPRAKAQGFNGKPWIIQLAAATWLHNSLLLDK